MPARTSTDPSAEAFGAAVKKARKERGISRDDLAHDIPRMDTAYLAAIERGAHAVTIPTALRIAAALRMNLSELVRDLGPVTVPRDRPVGGTT